MDRHERFDIQAEASHLFAQRAVRRVGRRGPRLSGNVVEDVGFDQGR
jgi:hypothetical protein